MSLHYLVKLETLITHVLPLSCTRKKLQNLSHRNCGLQIHQILIRLITACGKYRKRRCENTHHWSWRNETATKKWVDQAGSRRHCGSHPSAVSSIAPDQWCVFFYIFSCDISTLCNELDSWIQIWWIWRPQLRWDEFWSFFLFHLNGSTCAMSISSFTR